MSDKKENQAMNFNNLSYFFTSILMLLDLLWVIISTILVYWLQNDNLDFESKYLIITGFSFLNLQWFKSVKIYTFNPSQSLFSSVKSVAFLWLKINLFLAGIIFISHMGDSALRIWLIAWFVCSLAGFTIFRIIFYSAQKHYHSTGKLATRVVVIGAEYTGRWVILSLQKIQKNLIEVVGIYDDQFNPDRPSVRPMNLQPITIQGGIDQLVNFVRRSHVDIVVVTLPYEAAERIHEVVKRLRVLPVQIHVCPGRIDYELDKHEVVDLGGIPMLKISGRPLEKGGWLIKQIEDTVIASIVVFLTTPLMLLIALAVKLETHGPAIYTQQRGGFNGVNFKMYKFRTMRYDPDALLVQAQPQDSRVTAVGRFLRRHSLDELPQFFNVLKGDMSVVGPRPHAVQHDEEFSAIIAQYISRLRVKPGITGWAQINGLRGLTDTREKLLKRLEYDIYYIDHWSPWLDLYIIFKTIAISAVDKNAF